MGKRVRVVHLGNLQGKMLLTFKLWILRLKPNQMAFPQVYFKQLCRKCQAGLNPYRVESIQCQVWVFKVHLKLLVKSDHVPFHQVCCKTRCCCERKQRHIDTRRPHRQDLCGRCKGKGLSCDTIYSFKYIVWLFRSITVLELHWWLKQHFGWDVLYFLYSNKFINQ